MNGRKRKRSSRPTSTRSVWRKPYSPACVKRADIGRMNLPAKRPLPSAAGVVLPSSHGDDATFDFTLHRRRRDIHDMGRAGEAGGFRLRSAPQYPLWRPYPSPASPEPAHGGTAAIRGASGCGAATGRERSGGSGRLAAASACAGGSATGTTGRRGGHGHFINRRFRRGGKARPGAGTSARLACKARDLRGLGFRRRSSSDTECRGRIGGNGRSAGTAPFAVSGAISPRPRGRIGGIGKAATWGAAEGAGAGGVASALGGFCSGLRAGCWRAQLGLACHAPGTGAKAVTALG